MTRKPRPRSLVLALVVLAALAGCDADPSGQAGSPSGQSPADGEATPHTHGSGQEHVSLLVGDGTRAYEVGYTLRDVSLPRKAGAPGEVRFRVTGPDDRPVTAYIPEQTKDLHLYVVRSDLAVFRHLHPTQDGRGTWSAPLTLPEGGHYRVVAEFVARDDGGNGDAVMLGSAAHVAGRWQPEPVPIPEVGDDGTLTVAVEGAVTVGDLGRLVLVVRDAEGRAVRLGPYLGTFAHVTAFHTRSGSVVHMHPLGQPEVGADGTRLEFHTQFEKPGRYLAFVQARVDGFVHTLPVGVQVS
ncbi:hypothetical protein DDE18_14440 [Nocardioides gansuensis]|uniref:Heavy metal-binding domain-containing protein n=1 Tax=Nocardioides gansuensis TaxID=2138300 RepID=A0A2T8F8B7_9ACTN|nr:hypothetical protein [Nocardioides gansuensis]PVG81907.1 hypothetical protein DDE18_14440 [Nocardioides gansuensis]